MRFFQEVELPDYTTILEVAYWIAFGISPIADYAKSLSNEEETREIVEIILEKRSHIFDIRMDFTESFMKSVHPEMDTKEYVRLFNECSGLSPDEVISSIESWREITSRPASRERSKDEATELNELFAGRLSDLQKELDAAVALRELQNPFIQMLEMAQGKLFLKLVDGDISAKGVKLPNDESIVDNWEPDDWPSEFSTIEASEWVMSGIDWNASNLKTWKNTFLGIIVPTNDALRIFPKPDVQPVNVSAELYLGTLILPSDKHEVEPIEVFKRPRGAPSAESKILTQSIFKERLINGFGCADIAA